MKWTCHGDVRGRCGVTHRSRAAAERHCAADSAAILRRYPSRYPTAAYSDRGPMPIDDEAREDDRADHDWEHQLYCEALDRAKRDADERWADEVAVAAHDVQQRRQTLLVSGVTQNVDA